MGRKKSPGHKGGPTKRGRHKGSKSLETKKWTELQKGRKTQ